MIDPAPNTPVNPQSQTASQATAEPKSVLDVLLQKSLITADQVAQLQLEKTSSGKSILDLIEEKALLSEEELTKAKSQFYAVPFVSISEMGVSPEALNHLSESVARKYSMLPFAVNKAEATLSVTMKDPLDLAAIDFTTLKTGLKIIPHYATPSEIDRNLNERYAQNLSSEVSQALEDSQKYQPSARKLESVSSASQQVVRQAPITKIVETILTFALKSRASDVHIEPQEERTRVRYRIDGVLQEKLILPKTVQDAVVSRIKILSDLKIDEKRVPQDGRFNFDSESQSVDLRVSTLPTVHGEKVVMRLLKKDSSVPSLIDLGLRGLALKNLQDAIKIPHGIVLVTGPTGSGKTTTLYSLLHDINTPKVNIMTLEDPVEYQMPGVNQVQVNPQAGLTFASGLRSFLRQDPNIIMVGEIRDTETVDLALQASLTGHLVFSTLHTSSAAGAIPRLIDMKAEPFLLASTLTSIVAQRIARKINEKYKEEYVPEPTVVEGIKQVLGPIFDIWCKQNNKDPNNVKLYRCNKNRPETEPEYSGRIGIFEIMKIDSDIGKLILGQRPANEIEAVALKKGMLLMKQDGYIKALEGITTLEEVLRVAEV
ncbi:MAG: ATPase, T2SS/T4P/T4SS family [Patescibacteria group bacterium]